MDKLNVKTFVFNFLSINQRLDFNNKYDNHDNNYAFKNSKKQSEGPVEFFKVYFVYKGAYSIFKYLYDYVTDDKNYQKCNYLVPVGQPEFLSDKIT